MIGITGIVEMYQGKPEIKVLSMSQIKGQMLRESRSNVARLIDLCCTMGQNLAEGFGSMNLLSKMLR